MQTAFERLGIAASAGESDIRAAYHKLVKGCHPDSFSDPEQQRRGQEELILINVAYEQAMKIACSRSTVSPSLPCEQAKSWAKKLLERKQFELALLQLSKSESKDAEWFSLQGDTLTGLKQYTSAHQAFRAAVRMEPNNLAYRRNALDSEMRLKKAATLSGKALHQIKSLLKKGVE